jgi:predicted RNA-binding Zn-ribbon protein involved in translation (DUF1610 family)
MMAPIATMRLMNAIRHRVKMVEFALTNWLRMRVPALSATRVNKKTKDFTLKKKIKNLLNFMQFLGPNCEEEILRCEDSPCGKFMVTFSS